MSDYRCQFDGCDTILGTWNIREMNTMCAVHAHHDPCLDLHLPVCDECDTSRWLRPSGVSADGLRVTWACSRCSRINQKRINMRAYDEIPWGAVDLTLGLKTSEARAYFASMDRQKRLKSKALLYCLAPDNNYRLTILDAPKEAEDGPGL